MTYDWDAIILGAGAAGLFAATFAAERGRRVLLLEKGKKAGVVVTPLATLATIHLQRTLRISRGCARQARWRACYCG